MHVDLDFFDGRKGGHMSVSGISGVATKTSFALFFLRMLTAREHAGIVGEGAANLRVLVFNVKGEDLLWLDTPNRYFDEEAREGWAALGVEPSPFPSVRFWAPPRRRSGDVVLPDTGGRQEGVEVFTWTPREFIDEDLLPFLLTDANDQRNQIPFVRERVQAQLKRFAADVAGQPGAVVLRDPSSLPHEHGEAVQAAPGERVIVDLASLVDAVGDFLEPEDGSEPEFAWSGRVMGGTVSAFMRRLHAASARLGHLVQAGPSRRIDRAAASVTVVAIQSLHDQAQRFVVGALLNETFREKEESGQRLPLSVIVLDELNKYAPREGTGPLKDMLIDIAQRGRSLGVLLVGAQQTASRVSPEVLENAALRVAGRLDAAEAERSEYGWMLPSTRARARLLKPGTMVVSQPAIPVPLVVTFPFPPVGHAQGGGRPRGPGRSVRRPVAPHAHPPHLGLARRPAPGPPRPQRGVPRGPRRGGGASPTNARWTSSSSPATSSTGRSRRWTPSPSGSRRSCASAAGRPVVVVAGNHDSPELFEALAPLLRSQGRGVHLVGTVKRPDAGALLGPEVLGVEAVVACFPFLREGRVVDFMKDAGQWYGAYAAKVAGITEAYNRALVERAGTDLVPLLMAHFMVGGVKVDRAAPRGERELHMGEAYAATRAGHPRRDPSTWRWATSTRPSPCPAPPCPRNTRAPCCPSTSARPASGSGW